jgi:hypothetical protein
MREKGPNNAKYIMLDSRMVSCRDEQLQFEQEYMDRLQPPLNMFRAHGIDIEQTKIKKATCDKLYYLQHKDELAKKNKEYRDKNKDKIKARDKQYRDKNKDEINQRQKQLRIDNIDRYRQYDRNRAESRKEQRNKKYNCPCGGKYTHQSKSRHLKLKKHTDFEQFMNMTEEETLVAIMG